ncbi:ABC transporter permease [Streptomyces sp. NPDC088732]|uniref:ABC transporter permease n=1 Tax=Streptomyces sp. NPDC088732 TaxID=3365879 RepID=UPI00380A0A78
MTSPPEDRYIRAVRLPPGDFLRLGFLGIRIRVMRAALSALGISIGIATVIVVTGIPASSQRHLLDELNALGPNLLQAQAVPQPGEESAPLPEEAVAMARRVGPVTSVSEVANTHAQVRRSDRAPSDAGIGITVLASHEDLLRTIHATVRSGRFLSRDSDRFPTAVLGDQAAAWLGITRLEPRGPVPLVFVGGQSFTVTGILAPMPLTPELDQSVLVGWGAARTYLGFDNHPTVVYVEARDDAVEAVRAVLPATLDPQTPELVQVSRPSDVLAAKKATQNTFSSLFLGLAGVALLVGGIGVANTMFISVLERRKEIGLRRALGANKGQIRGQFLMEAVMLSALGGIAGTVLGALAAIGYSLHQGWPPVVPLPVVTSGVAGAVVVGVLAGVYPSVRASRLPPTEALAL